MIADKLKKGEGNNSMRHTLHKNLLMVLISLLFLGCGAIHEDNRFNQSNPLPSIENPENNDSNDNAPEDEDDDNNPPPNEVIVANVTWQFLMNNVWNKAEYSCLECHGGGETSGGLNMDSVNSANGTLDDLDAPDTLNGNRFYQKVAVDAPAGGGNRMPLGVNQNLSNEDLELVMRWVLEEGGVIQ